jgi:hypothetical protein
MWDTVTALRVGHRYECGTAGVTECPADVPHEPLRLGVVMTRIVMTALSVMRYLARKLPGTVFARKAPLNAEGPPERAFLVVSDVGLISA